MNCQDIASLLDKREMLALPPAREADVDKHLFVCEACAHEWRAARALHSMKEIPTPPARPGLFAESMRRATQPGVAKIRRNAFWSGAGVGGAMAAGIAIAVMTLNPTLQRNETGAASGLTIALNQPHDVSVAIDSAKALTGAQIRVVLTGGIQLAGFGGQSVVSWTADLDRGVNRLTLPVIAVRPTGGQVLVEVEHSRKRQIFVVDVGVAAAARGDSPASMQADQRIARNESMWPTGDDRPDFVNWMEPPRRCDV